ncbi:putative N-acetyltransferase (TIGR04045 family) [Nakamurella sp. UYEF19]|uniref:MSMEG_0567/sll0787 family protein n=1 Tax=Nakamurella sp. UYEF19 TaxID=1756392 RepID=UPI00339127DB
MTESLKALELSAGLDVSVLTGTPPVTRRQRDYLIRRVEDAVTLAQYRDLRKDVFVAEQGLFSGHDLDDRDQDPRTVVLVATDSDGRVIGGVRLSPAAGNDDPHRDIGWWTGSRLVVAASARRHGGVGRALVRAACAHAETLGVLRFDAVVQGAHHDLFRRIGWTTIGHTTLAGAPHVSMRWPIGRIQRLAEATKGPLADLLAPLRQGANGLGGNGFVGDDGAVVPGSDVIAACDAILPSMVERDPEWAGWCSVLVNINDLSAMGARAVGLLDAIGARDASFATRILHGIRRGSQAWGVPVLGGHTQLGVPASLSVTAVGRTDAPVPAGGGSIGDSLWLSTDLGGGWRPGYHGRQWDSTSHRSAQELRSMATLVARTGPTGAKDVSMAGLVGTTGMLAEAAGCGAVIDVDRVPMPDDVAAGDWFTCFPGFSMVMTAAPGHQMADAGPATTSRCGELTGTPGVQLRWPDGEITHAITGDVTGLGTA